MLFDDERPDDAEGDDAGGEVAVAVVGPEDPGYLSDANLEARAEPAGENPFQQWGDSEDVDSEEGVVDADGEPDVVDDEPAANVAVDDDPAPQLKDLPAAKKAYNEVRGWANTVQNENLALKAQLEALQNQPGYDEDDYAEEYDPQEFSQIAQQNPMEAFQYALRSGSADGALAAIAQVQSDANEYAARAAIARQDQDEQQAAYNAQLARNATGIAEQLRAEYSAVTQQAQVAPLREQAARDTITSASVRVNQKHSGDPANYGQQIRQIVQEVPGILGDGSPAAIERGIERAYKMAKAEAAGEIQQPDIEALVAAKVEEAIAAQRKGKQRSAGAAQGEGSGRRAPGGDAAPSEGDGVRGTLGMGQKQASIGLNGFWNL